MYTQVDGNVPPNAFFDCALSCRSTRIFACPFASSTPIVGCDVMPPSICPCWSAAIDVDARLLVVAEVLRQRRCGIDDLVDPADHHRDARAGFLLVDASRRR